MTEKTKKTPKIDKSKGVVTFDERKGMFKALRKDWAGKVDFVGWYKEEDDAWKAI